MQNAVMAIYGTIQSQQIKIEIMISVPLVRNLGEAFRETWQGEHLIILTSHPFQELLPMLFSPQSKHGAKKVFFPDADMVPHKIKTRPSMVSFGNEQQKKLMPAHQQ